MSARVGLQVWLCDSISCEAAGKQPTDVPGPRPEFHRSPDHVEVVFFVHQMLVVKAGGATSALLLPSDWPTLIQHQRSFSPPLSLTARRGACAPMCVCVYVRACALGSGSGEIVSNCCGQCVRGLGKKQTFDHVCRQDTCESSAVF